MQNHPEISNRNLGIAILLNVCITILQVIGSFFSGSLALLSDAMHNFTDVVALIISWVANKLSKSNFSQTKTFGYKRAEIIAALINAMSLIFIAIYIFKEAIERIQNPQSIDHITVIILGGLSIILNGLCVYLLHSDKKHNINIKSAYLHLFADMITSVAVVFSGLIIYFWNIYWVDTALSIIISIYLLIISWKLVIQGIRIIMQFAPKNTNIEQINQELQTIDGVSNIHHVHLWQLNDNQIYFEAHVRINSDYSLSKVNSILLKVKEKLSEKFNIRHSTLQPELQENCNEDLIVYDN